MKLLTFDNLFLACVAGVESGRGYREEEKREGLGRVSLFPFALFSLPHSLPFLPLPRKLTCSRHYDTLAKTRSRMTMATTFSRQNDAGTRMNNS